MILGIHRIHVNDAHDAEFPVESGLKAVDDLVGMHQRKVRGNLGVKGDDLVPGPVIMDQQIVHIKNPFRVKDHLFDPGAERRVGGRSEKGRYGVKRGADPCVKDEERDSKSAPPVQMKSEFR